MELPEPTRRFELQQTGVLLPEDCKSMGLSSEGGEGPRGEDSRGGGREGRRMGRPALMSLGVVARLSTMACRTSTGWPRLQPMTSGVSSLLFRLTLLSQAKP